MHEQTLSISKFVNKKLIDEAYTVRCSKDKRTLQTSLTKPRQYLIIKVQVLSRPSIQEMKYYLFTSSGS